MQFNIGKAIETFGRFAINSTIGGAGILDIAKRRPFKLPRRLNGFADTLGYYGFKPVRFMFLPLIGPTTAEDLVGNLLDRLLLPLAVGKPFNRVWYTLATGVVSAMEHRSRYDDQLETLRSIPMHLRETSIFADGRLKLTSFGAAKVETRVQCLTPVISPLR